LGLRGTKQQWSGEDYIIRNLVILTDNQIYSDDQIKKNEMGEARSTYVAEKKCIQGFEGKPERNRPRGILRRR